jgi:hypothetical protein
MQAGDDFDHATKGTPAPQLPDALMDRILLHVPLSIRLTTSASVCKAWAAAAVRATSSVQCTLKRQDAAHKLPLLQTWLQQSGQQLTSLHVAPKADRVAGIDLHSDDSMGALQLPVSTLSSLKVLSLECLDISLPADAAASTAQRQLQPSNSRRAEATASGTSSASTAPCDPAGSAHSLLPALQHLKLQHCSLDTIASLGQLAQSPILTSLQLGGVAAKDTALPQPQAFMGFVMITREDESTCANSTAKFSSAIARLLQRLPGLPMLAVQAEPPDLLQTTALHSVTAMQSLQHLSMGFGAVHSNDTLPTVLPPGLTRLELVMQNVVTRTWSGGFPNQPGIQACLKSLQHMQHLQELDLQLCDLDPTVLGSSNGLRKLQLGSCDLLPRGKAGAHALLGALQGFTALQAIHLDMQVSSSNVARWVAPAHFAALTESAHLTSLELSATDAMPLPRGAVRYMFPDGCSKPQLQVLSITDRCGNANHSRYACDDEAGVCLKDRDISRIVSACPGLNTLQLMRVVQPGTTFNSLQGLPESFSSLSVGGQAFGDAAAVAVVQLTQLRALMWSRAHGFSDVGFQRLTALTGPTYLCCDGFYCSLSDELFSGRPDSRKRNLYMSSDDVSFLHLVFGSCLTLHVLDAQQGSKYALPFVLSMRPPWLVASLAFTLPVPVPLSDCIR